MPTRTLPTPEALLAAWSPWQALVGITSITTEEEYDYVAALLNMVLDIVRDETGHPLEGVMLYLGSLIEAWDDVHYNWPDLPGREMLASLMESAGLSQGDLAEIVSQSHLSEILSGKRAISKTVAKRLAKRFHIHADLFLE